ncbi:MAG: DUF362 domain-containing protein [Oscillospiraceae bacterium]|nr:DUF362 domain-containing protein [Oscillospiraceae bacterium]
MKTQVTVRRLASPHQKESFTQYLPLNQALKEEVFAAVKEIFDAAGGRALLKASGDVYLKPNAVDCKAYSYTRPEVIEAAARYWRDNGARDIYLFENCTQGNFTRMVFAITGYSEICKRLGVKQVFLDEMDDTLFEFKGKKGEGEEAEGYATGSFNMPKFIVERLIEGRDENLYISLPKLKTHSMADVTLGIKNQWAFPQQADRRADHNYNLPHKLADVLGYVRPDFTLIEGVEATIHGHYPVTAFADTCVLPFQVLIASQNVVAADMVGARLFGMEAKDVPHIKIALARGYGQGVHSWDDIDVIGDISDFTEVYQSDLLQRFPADVAILRGKERLCREGCQNNPLTLLQVLGFDHGGKGGWTLIMGKGHDPAEIAAIQGKVLIAGHCAAAEVGDALVNRLGKKNVYFSGYCNDLCASINAMCHLMHVNPLVMAPYPFAASMVLLAQGKLHGTKARVSFPFAHLMKVV